MESKILFPFQIASFLDIVPVDGLWINMNEISNFCDGECSGGGKKFNTTDDKRIEEFVYKDEKDVGFNPNSPPFAINNKGSRAPLNVKTLDMDALHYDGVLEYNVHNLYGTVAYRRYTTPASNYFPCLDCRTDGKHFNQTCLGKALQQKAIRTHSFIIPRFWEICCQVDW